MRATMGDMWGVPWGPGTNAQCSAAGGAGAGRGGDGRRREPRLEFSGRVRWAHKEPRVGGNDVGGPWNVRWSEWRTKTEGRLGLHGGPGWTSHARGLQSNEKERVKGQERKEEVVARERTFVMKRGTQLEVWMRFVEVTG